MRASTNKTAAREAIRLEWQRLGTFDVPVLVRINAVETSAGEDDLAWIQHIASVPAVILPKAESLDTIARVHQRLNGVAVLPMIESAAGYAALPMVAGAPGVMRLIVGHLDFMTDTGIRCNEDQLELAPLRFAVTMATRLNRLAPAVDSVTPRIDDERKLREDVDRARRFGFGGKLCIHPRQVGIVHDVMAPTEQELEWARKVVAADAASNGAAVQVDGCMVDRPVVLRARQMLSVRRG